VSIDARVANTYRDGRDLIIELIPSAPGRVAGADWLRVVNLHWDPPPPGTMLWAVDSTVCEGHDVPVYARYGDGCLLHENDDNPPPWHCKGPPFHPNCQCG
jgi:hypothetical protein